MISSIEQLSINNPKSKYHLVTNIFAAHFSQDWLRDPVVWLDCSGEIKNANMAMAEVFGSQEDSGPRKIWDLGCSDLRGQWARIWATMMAKKLVRFTSVFHNVTDQAIHMEICGQHYYLNGFDYMCAMFRDVSEHVRVESDLRKLSEAVQQSSASIIITNAKAEIEYVNPAFLQMTGYTWDEVKGENPRILKSGFTPPAVFSALWNTITKGKAWKGEFRNKRKDGSLYWESVTISPIMDQNGLITHFVAVKEDETLRKQEELFLMDAKQLAEEANAAKSMFLANMSHEIRTPMNGIVGFTNLLLEMVQDEEQRDHLEMIKRSSDSLLSIINDILDLSKIESHKMELFNAPFDLHQTVSDVVRLCGAKLLGKPVQLTWNIDGLPQWVYGDDLRFRQVLTNLLGNAVKFTSKGKIALTSNLLEQRDGSMRLMFHIIDTGPGIPVTQHEHIFEPFQQADNSTTRNFGGTGLGLTLCRKLIRLMGGDIRLSSEVGKGSCFSFDVTFGSMEAKVIKSAESEQKQGRTFPKKLHILLCEDNPINQKLTVKILTGLGCTVDVAENGAQGVDMQEARAYDLILMDVQMPVMDGLATTQKIRSLGHTTPIVALTANAMKGDMDKCLSAGMDAYLTKPISRDRLFDILVKFSGD